MGERTPREGIRVWELIIRESADFTLLIIGSPGALVTFLNYIPGLLFPKKIMYREGPSTKNMENIATFLLIISNFRVDKIQ